MKMVMKSWNMKNWPKIMEFCDSVIEFCQICPQIVLNLYHFGHRLEIKHRSRKPFFRHFLQNVTNLKLEREMVMENQEMVMEKLWKNILSSLWEP